MKNFNESLITKYTDLKNNDSLSSYKQYASQQNHNAYKLFYHLITEVKPRRILEIGTALGGFTSFLLDTIQNVNINCNIRSYDIYYHRWYEDIKANGADIRIENIFTDDFTVSQEIITYIQSKGISLVLCDGGDKVKEFKTLSKYLKVDDIIMTHDYAPNKQYFEEYVKDKIWNWHEIQDSDIENSIYDNNLKSYMRDEFLNAAWACFRKL